MDNKGSLNDSLGYIVLLHVKSSQKEAPRTQHAYWGAELGKQPFTQDSQCWALFGTQTIYDKHGGNNTFFLVVRVLSPTDELMASGS